MSTEIFSIIAREMGLEVEFTIDSKLSDLGLDSIQIMMMIVIIEEKFGIVIDDADLIETNFETVRTVLDLIAKYKGAAS